MSPQAHVQVTATRCFGSEVTGQSGREEPTPVVTAVNISPSLAKRSVQSMPHYPWCYIPHLTLVGLSVRGHEHVQHAR